ncbi:MAG: hypothetical protein ACYST6_20625 [Planctomycetota bacterium]
MAALHGKKGRAVGAGLTFEIYSWTLNATADTAESTVMDCQAVGAATHWKSHAVGFKDWTATVEGRLPAAGIGMTILGTSLASPASYRVPTVTIFAQLPLPARAMDKSPKPQQRKGGNSWQLFMAKVGRLLSMLCGRIRFSIGP